LEGLSDASQCEQQAVLEGVIHMQIHSVAIRDQCSISLCLSDTGAHPSNIS
jgi:hypothetical protein